MTRREFIQQYGPAVIDSTQGTGIFPSVKMAQAILESSTAQGVAGGSILARKYNNYFGIKADSSWKGKSVNLNTGEVFNGNHVVINDSFRVYSAPVDSFKDHTSFLEENQRYTNAGVFSAETPEDQARALKRAGYATDPDYAETLISLIRNYNLNELDKKKI